LPKNTNLLPEPGKVNPHSTTFDNQLIELESVDSTNNYAMARIHEGMASEGLVYLAHNQRAGKGQRGKIWQSEPGQNLMISLIIEPSPLEISQQFLFSASIALGILDLLKDLEGKNWSIKWPNDIYWNDRKAAGILIESVIQGINWLWAVVGIGMNLNQESFPDDIPNAISLKQITGKTYQPVSLAWELIPKVRNRIARLQKDPEHVLVNLNQTLYKKDQVAWFKKGDELFETILKCVDAQGCLITEAGKFSAGEISFIAEP
jgi:BirA family transcriptional regulator, biotin operon repressor / biotin---[acetyl-CoA-carboxylase] ligase